MRKSASNASHRFVGFHPKGLEASLLRRRKYALARQFNLPDDLLGGSLTLTHRRCGQPTCRCASGDQHPMWTLTYSVAGTKHVQIIPSAAVASLQPLAKRGQEYRQAVIELLALNAQLVTLWQKEQRARRHSQRRRTSR